MKLGNISPKSNIFKYVNKARKALGMDWNDYLIRSVPLMLEKYKILLSGSENSSESSLLKDVTNGKEQKQTASEVA